jgi:hypothetical protein
MNVQSLSKQRRNSGSNVTFTSFPEAAGRCFRPGKHPSGKLPVPM